MPPELDEQVAVIVAEYAHLGVGDFADLSSGAGFKIQNTAKRAISLAQLMMLAAHIIRRVEVNREKWIVKKYVDGVATDHCVTSAYEVRAADKRGQADGCGQVNLYSMCDMAISLPLRSHNSAWWR